jgi:hypothetical protein
LSFGNSLKSARAKSGEYGGWPMAECTFLLKTATLEAKNILVRCRGEEINERSLHNSFSLVPHGTNTLSILPRRMSDYQWSLRVQIKSGLYSLWWKSTSTLFWT